jgi:hypothetical protein
VSTQDEPVPDYPLGARPRYAVGQHLHGFNFSLGEEVSGKIVKIKPQVHFSYVLDTGVPLSCWDDIYGVEMEGKEEEE